MEVKNKIAERLNSVLIIDNMSSPNGLLKRISQEVENALSGFVGLTSRPVVEVSVDGKNKYKFTISFYARFAGNRA